MKKLPKQLAEIEKDCLRLKKKNDLTERGEGELFIINLVKKHIKKISKMKTKIFNLLLISILILNLSFIGAGVSTTISEVSQAQVEVTESVEISQAQVVIKKCYGDEDCKDILCVIPIDGNYEVYKKCNLSVGKCYCDLYRVVDYNEKFVLKKGQTAIIPGGYFITLEDMYGVCKMNDYCYSIARLSYFDGKKFYLKEGESKQFGSDVIPIPKEKPVLKLLKIENNEAIFIVYPNIFVVNLTECEEGEVEYYDCNEGFIENHWIKRKCKNGEWINNVYILLPGASPCSCSDNSVCKEGHNCMDGKCMKFVIFNATASITSKVMLNNCEGCLSDNKCLPISYRTSDQYCDADKSLKNQKQEEEDCNNNFECESNICVGGKCISGGLIQGILNFLKKLLGL